MNVRTKQKLISTAAIKLQIRSTFLVAAVVSCLLAAPLTRDYKIYRVY